MKWYIFLWLELYRVVRRWIGGLFSSSKLALFCVWFSGFSAAMTEAAAETGAVHADVVWHETHVTREQRQEIDATNLACNCALFSRAFLVDFMKMICLPGQELRRFVLFFTAVHHEPPTYMSNIGIIGRRYVLYDLPAVEVGVTRTRPALPRDRYVVVAALQVPLVGCICNDLINDRINDHGTMVRRHPLIESSGFQFANVMCPTPPRLVSIVCTLPYRILS